SSWRLSKGGADAPPFGIRLYNFLPLPYCKGTDYSFVPLREGVRQRRWPASSDRPSRQARPGGGPCQICATGAMGAAPSPGTGNKKEGRSIVTSPAGWYDNAPTLSRRGCAALKVARRFLPAGSVKR